MNEIQITNPHGNLEAAQAMCAYIAERTAEILASIDAVEITADNYSDAQTKATINDLADAVEDIRERGKRLVKEVCAASEAQRVLTAIDSRLWSYSTKADPNCAYARLSAALKALKDKVAEFNAAALPPPPTHTYIMQMEITDGDLKKVVAAVTRCGARFRVAEATKDKDMKWAERFFAEMI